MHATSVWLSSLALAAAGGWFAATMFAGPATGREPRVAMTLAMAEQSVPPGKEEPFKAGED